MKLLLVLLFSVITNAQSIIDFEHFNSDTVLTEFILEGYKFSSIKMATNYGDNLDIDGTSLFLYGSDIIITKVNNQTFYAHNLRAYQVSENQGNILIIEGWLNSLLKYRRTFIEIDFWRTLNLDYIMVDKLIIKPNNYKNDYNLDNISLGNIILFPTNINIRRE